MPLSSTVFDVGANIGDWSAAALAVNPSLDLHCFEPSLTTFRSLELRGLPGHVKLNNLGLSSEKGSRALHIFGDSSGLNSLYPRTGLEDGWHVARPSRVENIRVDTLDAYAEKEKLREIDFVKMDVEGHEMEVLAGAAEFLKSGRIKYVQFEYGGANIDSRVLLKDFFAFFQPLHFALFKICPAELRAVTRYDQRLENFRYQNWLAVQSDLVHSIPAN